jgi:1-deoxyxylulose-5-phosphate synthase
MQYKNLGKTGLKVSRICFGCMSFGDPAKGRHSWVANEQDGRAMIKKALDSGINFFDTANVYAIGTSEEMLGRAMRDFARRDELVIASKVHGKMREDPNGKGLSRKAIMTEIDGSLKRLQTDYLDLYQTHRWDDETPIEETLEALHDMVKAGKVRYIGASSMKAWQFSKALYTADLRHWTRFVSMQPQYNLMYREEEREMVPLCVSEGIGIIPWSPLARGKLARPSTAQSSTLRDQTDPVSVGLYKRNEELDKPIVDRLTEVAWAKGLPQAQVALAWLLSRPAVTSAIVGTTKIAQLDDALAAVDVILTSAEMAALEEPYRPHPWIAGA